MAEKINKDMTFTDALKISGQEGAEVMGEYGLHCIGCHVAAHETIAQGCAAHGISEADTDKMVEKINVAMEKAGVKKEEE